MKDDDFRRNRPNPLNDRRLDSSLGVATTRQRKFALSVRLPKDVIKRRRELLAAALAIGRRADDLAMGADRDRLKVWSDAWQLRPVG